MNWSRLPPSRFYFWVNYNYVHYLGRTMVVIVPSTWFQTNPNEFLLDDLSIKNIVPEDLNELGEGIFVTNKSPEVIRQEMLNLGFKESVKFSDQCIKEFISIDK